ncbi:MAG TPA: ShlB/FhaC/HecB family hemolysin secretion/activation protein, partial [Lysobacter sp.]
MAQVDTAGDELRRQQERERVMREQQEQRPDVRLQVPRVPALQALPTDESPCFRIDRIVLDGDDAQQFGWALKAAELKADPAAGRCLGTKGIGVVMRRVQNAIVARGYVTTRVLAAPQDLQGRTLSLTVVPGRIHAIRFADGTDPRVSMRNSVSVRSGDLLQLRDIEQALENFQRLPTVAADIQIVPTEGDDAKPGESDLVISYQQRAVQRIGFTLDDSGSEATGKLQAGITASLDNLTGAGDMAYVNLGHDAFSAAGRGTQAWAAHWDVPLGYWQLGATASSYDYHQAVAGPFETYVYSGSSDNAEVRLSRMLFRNATTKFGAFGRGWLRTSDNFADDTEIEVQRRRTAGWEAGFTYRKFVGPATLDANASYRHGTGAFDALEAPEQPFGEGTSRMKVISADAQVAVPFQLGEQRFRYTGSWRAQWNDDTPLVPQDRFAIGGRFTVRGFDGDVSLTGDRGWLV